MTSFGLDSHALERVIAAVSDASSVAECGVDARFAGAAWSWLVEPGDGTAGALVASLGPVDALTALVEEWSVERIRDAV